MTIVNPETGEILNGGLTAAEFLKLRDAEQVIKAGLETFVEVGQALAEIRDSRLYRNTHGTFEAYCSERWGMDRRNANRTIEAAEVVARLGSMDPTAPAPTNIRQARELTKVEPEPAVQIMREVHRQTNGRPTAKLIKEAVGRHLASVPTTQDRAEDEAFWNEAAEKLTENGTVAKWQSERPYSGALISLTRAAEAVAEVELNPADLAAHIPDGSRHRLVEIQRAHAWLTTFITAYDQENA